LVHASPFWITLTSERRPLIWAAEDFFKKFRKGGQEFVHRNAKYDEYEDEKQEKGGEEKIREDKLREGVV